MKKKTLDLPILIITIILVLFGIVMVFSASFYMAQNSDKINDGYHYLKSQSKWALIGLFVMFVASLYDYRRLKKFSKPLLFLSIGLLGLLLAIGEPMNNATRWFKVGGISFQPSELAKLALILFLAEDMSKKPNKVRNFFTGFGLYLLVTGIFFALIFLQPDLSTAGSIVIIAMAMLFVGGASFLHMGILGASSVYGIYYLLQRVDKSDYRIRRFLTFLNPWADPHNDGHQVIQSLYSLGSGGLFGLGLGQSRQKFLFLPYGETDFIFSIIGEELGFVGGLLVISLFVILIWRGAKISLTAPDMFGCLLAMGITSMIAIQTIINIAVVTSSMPATGLPLPFISAGGTSLVFFMGAIGVLLNISKYSTVKKRSASEDGKQ